MTTQSHTFDNSNTQDNELHITVDVPAEMRANADAIKLKSKVKDGIQRFKISIPTLAKRGLEEEWCCRHDTTIIDVRSGVSGSLSKRMLTTQRRALITNYFISHGRPLYKLRASGAAYSFPPLIEDSPLVNNAYPSPLPPHHMAYLTPENKPKVSPISVSSNGSGSDENKSNDEGEG